MTRAEIEAELHEAVQSYRDCSASAENARQMLALGMGSISDVTTKTYLEESAHARWLKAAERFAAIAPLTPTPSRAATTAAPGLKPTPRAPAIASKASARAGGSFDLLGFLNDRVARSENDWRSRYGLRSPTKHSAASK